MAKETSAFSLIILLFIILIVFWIVSSFQMPVKAHEAVQTSEFDQAFIAQSPLIVLHKTVDGVEHYSGSVVLPACDEMQTELSKKVDSAVELNLSLRIVRPAVCDDPNEMIAVPFIGTYTSSEAQTDAVPLKAVHINSEDIAFSIVESQKAQ